MEIILDQMTLEEKAGRFFHTMIRTGENGKLEAKKSPFELPDVKDLLLELQKKTTMPQGP